MKLPHTPRKTTPAFGFKMIERSLLDCFGKPHFKKKDQSKVLEYFARREPQPACSFCGDREVKRWDHLVPVIKGGETVLGNMVLACATCDDSKGSQQFDEWMTSTALKSPRTRGRSDIEQQVERIKDYVTAFGYVPKPIEQRLTPLEQERRSDLLQRLGDLRNEVEGLIHDYHERTGNL